jgi:hypothetical protein
MLNFHFWTVKIMFQAPKSGETIKPEDAYYWWSYGLIICCKLRLNDGFFAVRFQDIRKIFQAKLFEKQRLSRNDEDEK